VVQDPVCAFLRNTCSPPPHLGAPPFLHSYGPFLPLLQLSPPPLPREQQHICVFITCRSSPGSSFPFLQNFPPREKTLRVISVGFLPYLTGFHPEQADSTLSTPLQSSVFFSRRRPMAPPLMKTVLAGPCFIPRLLPSPTCFFFYRNSASPGSAISGNLVPVKKKMVSFVSKSLSTTSTPLLNNTSLLGCPLNLSTNFPVKVSSAVILSLC